MTSVLITGGSGLVGQRLTTLLFNKGYQVHWLSRKPKNFNNIPTFKWDIPSQYIDEEAFKGISYIIHLAGAGIVDKPWNKTYKQTIANSRIASTKLLFEYISQRNSPLKAFISASAIGYYGTTNSEHCHTEQDAPTNDFLGKICDEWEQAAQAFQTSLHIRSVQLRTGVVLSKSGGALKKLIQPINMGLGAKLGSGKQYMPSIHIDDLCQMYIYMLENESTHGAYNATMPEQLTNQEITQLLAKIQRKPLWLPAVPPFIIRLFLGQRADMLLKGSPVIPQRILQETDFSFNYPTFRKAAEDCLYHL